VKKFVGPVLMSQVMRAVEVKERDGQIQKKLDDEVKKKKAGAGAAAAADSPYKLRNLCNLHKLTFVYCSMFLSVGCHVIRNLYRHQGSQGRWQGRQRKEGVNTVASST
jgi:hypothetical protein